MKSLRKLLPLTGLTLLGLVLPATAQALTSLHTFTGQSDGTGSFPYAHLILSGSTFYGTTYGGENSEGTVFKVNTNGSGFTVLYTFSGGSDGDLPQAGLVLSGSTLYGTTSFGGGSGEGTVFKVNTDGSGFAVLHSFASSDGAIPVAGLVLSGSTLYGTTSEGANGYGTIFKIGTSGSGFKTLYSFSGGGDGGSPQADLVLSGSTLYGTASQGASGYGTLFSFNTSSNSFHTLHAFTGGSDGGVPLAGLTLSGSTLYGTASEGGSGYGTLFSFNTSSSAFTSLYVFSGGFDGGVPFGGLVLSSGVLYGTTGENGGGYGTVFSFNPSSRVLNTLHSFDYADGSSPVATLTLSGSTLYGVTTAGGAFDYGTLFKIGTNGSSFATVYNFPFVTFTDGSTPRAGLVRSGNMLYGTTTTGGDFGQGAVYAVSLNGEVYRTLYSFTGGTDGATPSCRLVLSGNTLYGTAAVGGMAPGYGTVFKVNTDGSGFGILHTFKGTDGSDPFAGLTLSGSTLYGTTTAGGKYQQGTIFKVGTNGSGFSVMYHFTGGADGGQPFSELLLSGSTLYGTASVGGNSDSDGTIFKITTGGSFTALYPLNDSAGDGLGPIGSLALSGSTLYGVTSDGGSGDNGTVYSFNTSSKAFTVLHAFTDDANNNNDGAVPEAGLVLSGSTLYGTTITGGFSEEGTVFSISTNGQAFQTLWAFTGGSDENTPQGELLVFNGVVYGTTTGQGTGGGTVFSLTP